MTESRDLAPGPYEAPVDTCECRALDSGMECDAVEYMSTVGVDWDRCQMAAEYIIPESGLKICPECRSGCYSGEGVFYPTHASKYN